MRTRIGFTLIALLAVAIGVAAAKKHDDVFMSGPPNETEIAQKVRHALLMLPYYSIFDDLEFRVDGSVVTLEGACPPDPPWDIKSDAGNVAKRIPGVTQVINNIKELPLSQMDWQIRRAEARAIYGNSDIGMRYGDQALPSIHIIVDNGHVTLEGVVNNQMDKEIAGIRANSSMSFGTVTNNLRLDQPAPKKN